MANMLKKLKKQGHKSQPETPVEEEPKPSTVRRGVIRPNTHLPDQELLDNLPKGFYDEQCDTTEYMLGMLERTAEQSDIDNVRSRKFQELQAVSRKLSTLVLEHHLEFVTELTRVSELREELLVASVICKNGQRHLHKAQEGIRRDLGVVVKHRRRARLLALWKALNAISTLRSAKETLTQLLESDDLISAVELWAECSHLAGFYQQFSCVSDLLLTFQDTRSLIEEHLERVLSSQCDTLDISRYAQILRAYGILDMGHVAVDILSNHFSTLVGFHAKKIAADIVDQAQPSAAGGQRGNRSQRLNLKTLCGMLNGVAFESCIVNICAALGRLMVNYHRIHEYHIQQYTERKPPALTGPVRPIPVKTGSSGNIPLEVEASSGRVGDTHRPASAAGSGPVASTAPKTSSGLSKGDGSAGMYNRGNLAPVPVLPMSASGPATGTSTPLPPQTSPNAKASATAAANQGRTSSARDSPKAVRAAVKEATKEAMRNNNLSPRGSSTNFHRDLPADGNSSSSAGRLEAFKSNSAPETTVTSGAASPVTEEPGAIAQAPRPQARYNSKEYALVKLEMGRRRLWQDVQKQVATCLVALDLSSFNLESYLKILGVVGQLVAIGSDFSQGPSDILDEAVRKKTMSYLETYHKKNLDQLKSEMEKDQFVAESLPSTYSPFDGPDFKFLRRRPAPAGASTAAAAAAASATASGGSTANITVSDSHLVPSSATESGANSDDASLQSEEGSGLAGTKARSSSSRSLDRLPVMVDAPQKAGTPTVGSKNQATFEDLLLNPNFFQDVQAKSYRDDATAKGTSRTDDQTNTSMPFIGPPHLSSSALFVVSCIGQYLHMMDVLKQIATEVFICLVELVEYYIYNAVMFSTQDKAFHFITLSEPSRNLLQRLKEFLVDKTPTAAAVQTIINISTNIYAYGRMLKEVTEARRNPDIVIDVAENLFGLPFRAVCAESIQFVGSIMSALEPYFRERLPANNMFTGFINDTIKPIPELRVFIYRNVAAKFLKYEEIPAEIDKLKWLVKEVRMNHNPYINNVVNQCKILQGRMKSLGDARVPPLSVKAVWTEVYAQINQAFVDGFSLVRKCNNEGRALMQVDYRQYLSDVARLAPVKPQPDFVDAYIKGYYMTENELEIWISKNHKNYTHRHLACLVAVYGGSEVAKKYRQRLTQLVDDLKGIDPLKKLAANVGM